MSKPEELLEKLGQMLEAQLARSDNERKESMKREERMNNLLQEALQKIPVEHNQTQQPTQLQEQRNQCKLPNNATPAPILVQNATLREFTTWKQKFEDFTLLTGVDKESNDRQKAVLRSLLDDEWFRVVKFALNIDMESPTVSVKTVIEKMQKYLRSQRNIVLDRKEFYSRNQHANEPFDEYYIALQEIAAFCDFCSECTDQQFRDRIVTGIKDENTVKELLAEKDLTLEKTINICRANENASKDSENLQATAGAISKISSFKKTNSFQKKEENQHNTRPWRDKKYQQQTKTRYDKDRSQNEFKSMKCKFCGRNWHDQLIQCPARGKNCAKCGIQGHFATVCMRSVTVESEEEDGGNAWRITLAGVNENISSKKTPKVMIKVRYNHHETELITTPDTGAEMSVIGINEAKKIGLDIENLKPSYKKLFAADGKQLTCLGTVPVDLKLGDKVANVKLMVVTEVKGFLLAWYHAIELNILPENFPQQIKKVELVDEIPEEPPKCSQKVPSVEVRQKHANLLMKTFHSVFEVTKELKTMVGDPMRIVLVEDAVPYALTTPRNIPFAWKDKIKCQLDEMVRKNIIKEVKEPTSWCHPLVPVAKKDPTEVRVCVDLTRLNKYVKRGPHPVTTALDAISRVNKGTKYYTKLDAKAGYWQIPIHEEDQVLTTFITPWGRYKFLRAPMGLSTSGDEYNRRGDEALEDCNNAVKVVDDVLVYDEEYQQHLNHVWEVLKQCQRNNITLNPEKFFFAKETIEYCGYQLSDKGILPSKEKLSAIKHFKTPENISELRSFLGMVNQLGQFSPKMSGLAEPLRQLLKKNNEFIWSDDHSKAFIEIKDELTKPPTLAFYDPNLPIVIQTDAARLKGLGFVCLQKHQEGWKLVDCGSRFLTDTETRYATIELEMLAIVYAVKKCRRFLLGRQEFEVITDHKPLIPIVNSKGLNEIENPRLQRLRESITQYNLILRWRKGSDHKVPDAFSRSPTQNIVEEDGDLNLEVEEHIHQTILSNIYSIDEGDGTHEDVMLDEVRKCSRIDQEYQMLLEAITKGFPEDNYELHPLVRPYANMKHLLCIDKDLIVCGQRLVIPKSMRKEVLRKLHSSHQGIEKSRRRARQAVYWPGINNDVENIVKSCTECQKLLPSHQKEPMIHDMLPKRAFQVVSADYFQHAGKEYIIYTDRFSGWPMVQAYNGEATATKLITTLRNFFAATGVPEVLKTDNGSQFKSYIFQKFLDDWSVKHVTSSPHYPQSNGHAESSVKSLKHMIIKSTHNGNLDTDKFTAALIEFRNTPRADGLSPSQIVFGYPIRSIIPIHPRSYMKHWQKKEKQTAISREKHEQYVENRYNTHAKPLSQLQVGTRVTLQNHKTGRWDVKGRVVKIGDHRKYLIRKEDGRELWRNRRFLRRYYSLQYYPTRKQYQTPVANHTPTVQTPPASHSPKSQFENYQYQPLSQNTTHRKPSPPKTEGKPGRPSRKRAPPDRLTIKPGAKTY